MLKTLFIALVSTAAVVSANPVAGHLAVTKSTTFSGNFEDGLIGSLRLKSRAGTSLTRRQNGSFNGDVVLCSGLNCASGCILISTSGGGAQGVCEFTLPNPFFSFGLTNPPTGTFYPFTIGINVAPAACPQNLFQLTVANTCFNINTSTGGNGWTFEPGDIAGMA
ncbi:hypothetical protein D9619_012705 [Psilocybe cf. subviscida]|uniref:Uncharacterized protein n=1 Tax=Psilocybe cf. subviscida TaxID=2480587 RepID=A0A8H5AQC3_9AGAR|nr:hypothetical protein D9619_012705 [Psilocybe cf. subviscida]